MKLKIVTALIVILSFSNCNAQTNKDKSLKPQTNVKVQKEYDEHGNLIRLDSTYTYFYSSDKNDTLNFKNFENQFNYQFQSLDSLFSKHSFFEESFDTKSLFNKNFFEDNFIRNKKEIEQLMKRMDSIRFQFYKNQKEIKESSKKPQTL